MGSYPHSLGAGITCMGSRRTFVIKNVSDRAWPVKAGLSGILPFSRVAPTVSYLAKGPNPKDSAASDSA